LRKITLLSKVKSVIRTFDAARSPARAESISTSSGQVWVVGAGDHGQYDVPSFSAEFQG
jgi:hypothetical protein